MRSVTDLHWHLEHLTTIWKRLCRVQVWSSMLHTKCNTLHHHSAFHHEGILMLSYSIIHHCKWLQSFRHETAVLPTLWFPQTKSVNKHSQVEHRKTVFVIDAAVTYWLFYNTLQNLLSPKHHKEIPKEFLHLPAYPYLPNRAVIIFRSYWIQFSKWPLKGSDATELPEMTDYYKVTKQLVVNFLIFYKLGCLHILWHMKDCKTPCNKELFKAFCL